MADANWESRARALSRIGAAIVAGIGAAVMTGWILDLPLVKGVLPGLVTMKVNTALAFIAAGVSLWLAHAVPTLRRRWVGAMLAAAIVAIGALSLAEYVWTVDLGIDQLLFLDDPGVTAPGRMAPATAVSFMLVGLALLALSSGRERLRSLVPWLATPANLIAMLAIVGYALGVSALYGIGPYTSMAVHTALAFLVLSLGLLAAAPDAAFVRVVVSDTAGGFVARRLLAAIPPGILALALVTRAGQWAGWYGPQFDAALMVVLAMVFVAAMVLWHAGVLYRVDTDRLRAESELRALNVGLERIVAERTGALQAALDEVKQLSGLLPICAWCKKIRDDRNYWHTVEEFLARHTDAEFTHGICPSCRSKLHGGDPPDA